MPLRQAMRPNELCMHAPHICLSGQSIRKMPACAFYQNDAAARKFFYSRFHQTAVGLATLKRTRRSGLCLV